MALVVEDGNGLATAESYISVSDFKAYHSDRGNDITLIDTEIEQKLRVTTEYIDLRWGSSAPGLKITENQALCFPTDYFIVDPVALPIHLVRATAEYAFWAMTNSLFLDNDGSKGPGIKLLKEKVGPIETQTEWSGAGDGSLGRKYAVVTKADALMRRITVGGQGGVYR